MDITNDKIIYPELGLEPSSKSSTSIHIDDPEVVAKKEENKKNKWLQIIRKSRKQAVTFISCCLHMFTLMGKLMLFSHYFDN